MSASFYRLSRSDEDIMLPCWHSCRFRFSRRSFFDHGLCKCANTVQNLLGIHAALARTALPMHSRTVVAPILPRDFLGEVFGDVLPHLAAHHIVHRREGRSA